MESDDKTKETDTKIVRDDEILTDVSRVGVPWRETLLAPEDYSNTYSPFNIYRKSVITLNGLFSLFGSKYRVSSSLPHYSSSAITDEMRSHTTHRDDSSHMCVSGDGQSLASLQHGYIVIRRANDGFTRVQNVIKVNDYNPKWAKLAINDDGSLLAFISSGGDGIVLTTMEGVHNAVLVQFLREDIGGVDGVAEVLFRRMGNVPSSAKSSRRKSVEMRHELLILNYSGHLQRVSISGGKKEFNIPPLNLRGIFMEVSSMVYHSSHNTVIIGGHTLDDKPGISMWKLTENSPHYELLYKSGKKEDHRGAIPQPPLSSHVHYAAPKMGSKNVIFKLCLSPDETSVAGVDIEGNLSVWSLSILTRTHFIRCNVGVVDERSEIPFDISWWSNDRLVVITADGMLTVLSLGFDGRRVVDGQKEGHTSIGDYTSLLSNVHQFSVSFPWSRDIYLRSRTQPKSLISPRIFRGNSESGSRDMFLVLQRQRQNTWETSVVRYLSTTSHSRLLTMNGIAYLLTLGYIPLDTPDVQEGEGTVTVIENSCSLSLFTQYTPQHLLQKRLEQQDYNGALELSLKHDLNTDMVYQMKWMNSSISRKSIEDSLSHVTDKTWIISQCQNRVPENSKGAKMLLEYGLNLCTVGMIKRDRGELTEEDKYFLMNRLLFLKYIDRLKSYKAIYNETFDPRAFMSFRDCDLVDASIEFASQGNFKGLHVLFTYHGRAVLPYRTRILSAVSEITSVEEYKDLLPAAQGLNKPSKEESTRVEEKKEEKKAEDVYLINSFFGHEKAWTQRKWHMPDWAEEKFLLSKLSGGNWAEDVEKDDVMGLQRATNEWMKKHYFYKDLKQFDEANMIPSTTNKNTLFGAEFIPQYPSEPQRLTAWYLQRAKEIDEKSGQIENSHQLVSHGIQNGIRGLEKLNSRINLLISVIYNTDADLSLEEFLRLGHMDIMQMLLRDSNPSNVVNHLLENCSEILQEDEEGENNPNHQSYHHLQKYMTEISEKDRNGLKICAAIIKDSRPIPEIPRNLRVIKDVTRLIEISLDCVYRCKRTDQWSVMNDIFSYLPVRDPNNRDVQYVRLQDRLDRFEVHLSASEVLHQYGLAPPIAFYDTINTEDQEKKKECRQLLRGIFQQAQNKSIHIDEQAWHSMIKDALGLQESVFPFVPKRWIYYVFVEAIFRSGKVKLVRDYTMTLYALENSAAIHGDSAETDEIGTMEDLVLKSSMEYFNSAPSIHHPSVDTALDILKTHPRTPKISSEIDLIQGTRMLSQFGLHDVLPVQIRLEKDRARLIERILAESKTAYQNPTGIHGLYNLLCADTHSHTKHHINYLITLAALRNSDYDRCYSTCKTMMTQTIKNQVPLWSVCRDLAAAEKFENNKAKTELISYALSHCPREELEDIMKRKYDIEAHSLEEIFKLKSSEDKTADHLFQKAKRHLSDMGGFRLLDHPFLFNEGQMGRYVAQLDDGVVDDKSVSEAMRLLHEHPSHLRSLLKEVAEETPTGHFYHTIHGVSQLPRLLREEEPEPVADLDYPLSRALVAASNHPEYSQKLELLLPRKSPPPVPAKTVESVEISETPPSTFKMDEMVFQLAERVKEGKVLSACALLRQSVPSKESPSLDVAQAQLRSFFLLAETSLIKRRDDTPIGSVREGGWGNDINKASIKSTRQHTNTMSAPGDTEMPSIKVTPPGSESLDMLVKMENRTRAGFYKSVSLSAVKTMVTSEGRVRASDLI
ncbi:neuroblastoma-amplified sequence-like [Planoprotostelium fungivorum]|uniref:Neuroblastoma-amplified sequence-like n=1 Tax=Planoprotostelium fungivorum TaxID=1890364 RepID=A0A2P6NXE3_9EUKA|nr:neuroblastoma-amplified sequence-like [Planoprotostelium fungivorum]